MFSYSKNNHYDWLTFPANAVGENITVVVFLSTGTSCSCHIVTASRHRCPEGHKICACTGRNTWKSFYDRVTSTKLSLPLPRVETSTGRRCSRTGMSQIVKKSY